MMSSLGSKMTRVFVYGHQVINAVFYVGYVINKVIQPIVNILDMT